LSVTGAEENREKDGKGDSAMRKFVISAALALMIASPALAGDTAVTVLYSPDRLGTSNPVFVSFSGTWDRSEDRLVTVDAGMNYQSKFSVSSYWLGGYGIRFQDRLGLVLSTGGIATPDGGSLVVGPNVRIDLVGPLSLRYLGLQSFASEKGSHVQSFTHLFGVQIKTLSF
jgi:hypothetical protein